ncbi:MAG TPA: MXAN_2562 family outer membrane beta-barrel protein [Polyangia bacterium]
MRRISLLALLALAGAARPAAADEPAAITEEPSYASPQRFAGEIKFGPYRPNIDSEFAGGVGPYKRFFGGNSGLLMAYELDVQLYQKFGTAAVGLGLAYFSKSSHSFPCQSGSGVGCVPDLTRAAGDETSLQILPLSLLGIYRFDWAANKYRVPLVPYVKFGLTYSFWWVNKGNGKVSQVTEPGGAVDSGRGGQFGLTASFGAALRLDAIDPGAGRELDGQLGINHTYVFWEWNWWGADGLGQKSPALKIGDSNWLAGLAFEF